MVYAPKDRLSPKIPVQIGRGSPKAFFAMIATTTIGFGAFWYFQSAHQAHKYEDPAPGRVPTWENRLQQPAESEPSNSLRQRKSGTEPRLPSNEKVQGEARGEGGGATWQKAMTTITGRGDESTQARPEHVNEPPAQRQKKDSPEEPYTKHG